MSLTVSRSRDNLAANTAENVKKVLAYREKGHNMRDIAKLTGLSSGSVHRI